MILTINGGSSSIKFALFEIGKPLQQVLTGAVENIGTSNAVFGFNRAGAQQKNATIIDAANHADAATYLLRWLETQETFSRIAAIGHRVVFGMQHLAPEKITPDLLQELKDMSAYDPDHLPEEIKLMELFAAHFPALVQVACFDTAFHATMPTRAKMLAVPRRCYEQGIHRYGFHGLSYAYLMRELERLAGKESADGKIILAHLGSGASLAAVKAGKCLDTTMGFTPASGLPMSTRMGDMDPGVAWYFMKFGKLNPDEFSKLVNHESGLLGISGTSGDMQELLRIRDADSHAAEAIELFCYQTKKWIGAYAAVLGGLDTLVFSGGIGEHSPEVRSRICDGLEFLGIELDEIKNMNGEFVISKKSGSVTAHVIQTNEEAMIAKHVYDMLNN